MYGAILGDIIGSPYEFDRGKKTKGNTAQFGKSRWRGIFPQPNLWKTEEYLA